MQIPPSFPPFFSPTPPSDLDPELQAIIDANVAITQQLDIIEAQLKADDAATPKIDPNSDSTLQHALTVLNSPLPPPPQAPVPGSLAARGYYENKAFVDGKIDPATLQQIHDKDDEATGYINTIFSYCKSNGNEDKVETLIEKLAYPGGTFFQIQHILENIGK